METRTRPASLTDRFFDFDAVDLDHARIGVRQNVVPTVSPFLQKAKKLEEGHLEMISLVPGRGKA